ncbi:3-hydroxyacyl-CoA dehydrogenase family protein [Anianabacter salinae]|uniref:3-hydroxyacyl-CoA dehydrogenase family protein n=1 Tax=Anianabacter salinae TaxID=2851023 RepID=UPI00225DDAAE|nr:3-hydroxyacyl-CoA dehydrogenase family protein [Anianabacter salinae]MBV0912301.1 hypothetical protein [Anianabacter salinae]
MLDRRPEDRTTLGQHGIRTLVVSACGAAARQDQCDVLAAHKDARAIVLDLTAADAAIFDDPFAAPSLSELAHRIERFPAPVIAALSGRVSGPCLALALAAHYRVAAAGAILLSPEASLGLVPAGAAAPRLMRLSGLAAAIAILAEGEAVPADAACGLRLLDKTTSGPVVPAAQVFARALLERGLGPRPTCTEERGLAGAAAQLGALTGLRQRAPALGEVLEATLLLPASAAAEVSEVLATETRRHPAAQARLHLASAECESRGTQAPDNLACAGLDSVCLDAAAAVLNAGGRVALIGPTLDAADAAADDLVARCGDAVIDRISAGVDPAALRRAEAVIVPLPLGPEPLRRLAETGPVDLPAALVSDLPLPASREALRAFPRGVPVQIAAGTSIAELGAGPAPDRAAIAALMRQAGIVPVLRRTDGPVGERLIARLRWAAQALLEEGAQVAQVDAAMRAARYARPVFETLDADGLDAPRSLLHEQLGPGRDARGAALPAILRAAGRNGQAAGHGYYLHGPDGPEADPALDHVLAQIRDKRGIAPRALNEAEILDALHGALVNAALELVAEGYSPATADLVAVRAAGAPAPGGGPLMAADARGLIPLRRALAPLAQTVPRLWAPHPLWSDAIKYGRRFCRRS